MGNPQRMQLNLTGLIVEVLIIFDRLFIDTMHKVRNSIMSCSPFFVVVVNGQMVVSASARWEGLQSFGFMFQIVGTNSAVCSHPILK